jgi:hypothetical protein
MKLFASAVLGIFLTAVGCASAQEIVSPTHVNATLDQLEGRTITVRGVLWFTPHKRYLQTYETRTTFSLAGDCLTLVDTYNFREELRALSGRVVKVTGKVLGDILSDTIDYGACSRAGLQVTSVH